MRDPGYPEVTQPDVLAYLEAENTHFEAAMAPLQPLTETIFQEMKGRIKEDEASVPARDGDWLYWRAFETGGQYRKWWRRRVDGGPDELILDEPALAEGKDYFRLGALTLSEDATRLAYSIDDDGSERFVARIRDLDGVELEDVLVDTMGPLVFSRDGQVLFYGRVNDQWRVDRIFAHRVGSNPADDVLVYHEDDIGFQCGLGMTHDRKWIIVATGSNTTSEVRLIPAHEPFAEPIVVSPRQDGVEYDVEAHDGTLFIVTNDTSPQFRLVTASTDAPGDWQERIAPRDDFYLTDVICFADFYVAEGRENGLDQVEIRRYDDDGITRITFPESSYVAGLDENPEYATDRLRLSYESMVTPDRVIEYDLATAAQTVLKEQVIPSGYDASRYATERVSITARDGTAIPVSIVYPSDFPKDGSRPLYLYGYGAYGIAIPPGFSTSRLSLVDRGFAYAIAHIRGGDDLGQQWQLDGKLYKRWNAFTDFVDVARGLIALGFTSAGKVCAAGGSAGGELVGVVLNTDPDLFGAVAAHVPFVDVLNTMLGETLPLTPGEWPEWGNPIEDKAAFDLIRSYCPYQNVRAQAYPPLLVTAGLTDPRVTYWEPAKWVARLRATKTDANLLLLKTNMGAGHGGKSGRFESLRETAEEFAFMIAQVGEDATRA